MLRYYYKQIFHEWLAAVAVNPALELEKAKKIKAVKEARQFWNDLRKKFKNMTAEERENYIWQKTTEYQMQYSNISPRLF